MQSSNKLSKCNHCNLEFDNDVMIFETISDKELSFCCKGCQGVFHLLSNEGLESFYDKVGSRTLHPIQNNKTELEKFDLEGYAKKYVTQNNGLNEISLIIDGIHCSACVWLNERVLHECDGIIETNINYTNHKAKIVWDPSVIKLSQIIEKIQSIGYNAYAYDAKLQEVRTNKTRREYYSRLLVGIFCTMNIMWIAIAQYAGFFSGISQSIKDILNFAEFVLATPALFYTGWLYFKGAYYGLKNKIINMDFLIVSGTLSTYLYSIYAMMTQTGEVYFESVTMIITFIFAGKYLEVLSKKNAIDSLDSISSSIPTEVTVIRDNVKSIIDTTEIVIGDLIEVKPGDKIAIDGKIEQGAGSFDESSISGESIPVYKNIGDGITSGTICIDSVIMYKATKDLSHSHLQSIATLLEDSLTKKPKIQMLANQITGYFSLMVLSMAILTFVGWYMMGVSFEDALIICISVIVIACPCALGLATPVATLIGVAVGAKKGILFKSSSHLETMAKATTVVLDKTGTITNGSPDVVSYSQNHDFDINLLYSLVKSSTHPISKAVVKYLEEKYSQIHEYSLVDAKNIEARGLSASYNNKKLLGGNIEFLNEMKVNCTLNSSKSVFVFAVEEIVVCTFELEDRLKEGAAETITNIKKLGLDVIMCTGDNEDVAANIAAQVGITKIYNSMLPKDKADIISNLQKNDKIVITVGDGINDALALSKSDISIAMGNNADITVNVSDIIFINNKITTLYDAIKLSRKVFLTIKQNLLFSLLYNFVTISFAVLGYVIPLVAAISMSLSSLAVVGNSIRIKKIFK